MKRVLSLVLALVMVLGMIPMGFAADQTAGEVLKGYGIIKGYDDGSLGEDRHINRAEMMVVIARMMGKGAEAEKFALPSTFTDLEGFGWAAPWIAYAELQEWTAGVGGGKFNPAGEVTLQEASVFMLKALGYVADVDFTWANAVEVATAKNLLAGVSVAHTTAVKRGELFTVMINTLNAEVKDGSMALGVKLGYMKPAAFAVKSVNVVNAKKVEVVFNQEVNKVSAETASNYNFVGLTSSWTPVLQADNKTVILTSTTAIANGATFVVIVNPIANKADATKLTETFTKTITFSDTVKPVFTGVTYPEAGTAVLNFSEDLSTAGTVVVYDGATVVTTVASSLSANKITLTGLTTDKEYKVVVVGAMDQSLNLIPAPIEVFVKSVISETVKPTVVALSTVGLTTVKVQFSEKLKAISTGVYANISINGTAQTGTQTFDTTNNTLTLTTSQVAGIYSVSVAGYTDLSNNVGETYTRAVAFTASAPVLQKTEVTTDSTGTFVVLTFDKAPLLTALTGTDTDITGTYTTPESVLKAFVSANLNEATAITAVGSTIKINMTGQAAGTYNLSIPAAAITDGTTARTTSLAITFTLTGAVVDITKPTIDGVFVPGSDASTVVTGLTVVPKNTVYVKYSRAMNSTAVNPANYNIDGMMVFSSAVFIEDQTLVKLTLVDGSLTISGTRGFNISAAVTGLNGVAINAYSAAIPFIENVKPALASAILINGTTIELTFSEAVKDTNFVSSNAGNDFEVYIDGVKSTIASVGTGATVDDNKLQVVLATAITPTQLASGVITVKVLDTANGTDIALNNVVTGTVVTVVK